ncbi:MAG: NUDIX domain-containing protein, partial [Candidatus Glassbacteria bacterium]|nr:NUDIX domain-containing protein [Candidatus Glassbacteria bacterium]
RDGRWTLPGGWADLNESPAESVRREVCEESEFSTRVVRLLAVYDKKKHTHPPHPYQAYKLFFLCELLGGEPRHSLETDGVEFFAEEEIPELSSPRVTSGQIARLFELHRHPDPAADFDRPGD